MLKSYPKVKSADHDFQTPSVQQINALLNYSKSLEAKKIKGKKVLIHLN
jgi:hypothetical protein